MCEFVAWNRHDRGATEVRTELPCSTIVEQQRCVPIVPCRFHDRGPTEVRTVSIRGATEVSTDRYRDRDRQWRCAPCRFHHRGSDRGAHHRMVCAMVQGLLLFCADCEDVRGGLQMMFMSGRLAMTRQHSLVDCSRTASIFAHDVTWRTGACNGESFYWTKRL